MFPFVDSVFNYAPGARGLFSGVNSQDLASPEFKAHIARVLGGLDRVISMLDNQATLDADLLHLKSQHDTRNIDAGSFAVSNTRVQLEKLEMQCKTPCVKFDKETFDIVRVYVVYLSLYANSHFLDRYAVQLR